LTFSSLYKLLFTSWLFVVVSRTNKQFEEVQNWLQTTLKQRKTWNQKSLGCLFTNLTWACFEMLSSSLHWSSITDNIGLKAEFTLSCSSVRVGFTDITMSILEKPRSLHFLVASLQLSARMRRPQRPHGYHCAICSFSSGGKIIQKKNPKSPKKSFFQRRNWMLVSIAW